MKKYGFTMLIDSSLDATFLDRLISSNSLEVVITENPERIQEQWQNFGVVILSHQTMQSLVLKDCTRDGYQNVWVADDDTLSTEILKEYIHIGIADIIDANLSNAQLDTVLQRARNRYERQQLVMAESNSVIQNLQRSNQLLINSFLSRLIANQYVKELYVNEVLAYLNINISPYESCRVIVIFPYEKKDIEYFTLIKIWIVKNSSTYGFESIVGVYDAKMVLSISKHVQRENIIEFFDEFFIAMAPHELNLIIGVGSKQKTLMEITGSFDTAVAGIQYEGTAKLNQVIFYDQNHKYSVVREVQKIIQAVYASTISIDALAQAVHVTPQYLCKIFKQETGFTLIEYITNTRMKHALSLLDDRSKKLYEIAFELGYRDANYFSRVFKQFYGESPSQYRKRK